MQYDWERLTEAYTVYQFLLTCFDIYQTYLFVKNKIWLQNKMILPFFIFIFIVNNAFSSLVCENVIQVIFSYIFFISNYISFQLEIAIPDSLFEYLSTRSIDYVSQRRSIDMLVNYNSLLFNIFTNPYFSEIYTSNWY